MQNQQMLNVITQNGHKPCSHDGGLCVCVSRDLCAVICPRFHVTNSWYIRVYVRLWHIAAKHKLTADDEAPHSNRLCPSYWTQFSRGRKQQRLLTAPKTEVTTVGSHKMRSLSMNMTSMTLYVCIPSFLYLNLLTSGFFFVSSGWTISPKKSNIFKKWELYSPCPWVKVFTVTLFSVFSPQQTHTGSTCFTYKLHWCVVNCADASRPTDPALITVCHSHSFVSPTLCLSMSPTSDVSMQVEVIFLGGTSLQDLHEMVQRGEARVPPPLGVWSRCFLNRGCETGRRFKHTRSIRACVWGHNELTLTKL